MAFNGRDYHAAFEDACATLPFETDEGEVRDKLAGLEWILWEAVRGVFFYAAVFVGAAIVLPVQFALVERDNWLLNAVFLIAMITIAFAAYWVFRLIFHFEVSIHVKGRKFGSGGLD